MSPNSTNAVAAQLAFDETVGLFDSICRNGDASQEQVDAAMKALNTAQSAYAGAVLTNIDSRTSFLRTLIGQLNGVTASIQTKPFGNVLEDANALTSTINGIIQNV